jgi:hypothetical protein
MNPNLPARSWARLAESKAVIRLQFAGGEPGVNARLSEYVQDGRDVRRSIRRSIL